MYRIGVDVGGTNTDAAILDTGSISTPSRGVLASCKTPTTPDVTSGIKEVVHRVLDKSGVDRGHVLSIAIGTTHFVNAIVEADARLLNKVAVMLNLTPLKIPPYEDFPPALKNIISGPAFYLDGGLEIDGREILPLNPTQIKSAVKAIKDEGITMVALVGVFSPLDHEGIHEEACKKIMLECDSSLSIVCSHAIGGPGLLERENATILNASILSLAKKTIGGFRRAIKEMNLTCQLYLTQNDGTLTDADTAARYPIKTFASGPTNSMTGAAFLAGLDKPGSNRIDRQVLVVDIGGTTTDVCALLPSGFPRQAPNFVEVGGVRTAFSMPEVLSIGLGGGSRIGVDETSGKVTVGPDSVGHYLTTKAMVFDGNVMTATDIVVASGAEIVGNPEKVRGISSDVVAKARSQIKRLLERVIDNMKVSAAPVTALLVGGGSIVHMDDLEGVAECIRPPHHDSANAVGAAIAKVAGEVDVIEILSGREEKDIIQAAEAKAIANAIEKGADKDDIKIVELEKLPLSYTTNKATRIIVKVVGRLRQESAGTVKDNQEATYVTDEEEAQEMKEKQATSADTSKSSVKPSLEIDIPSYRPDVKNNVWYLSPVDLEFIASGVGVLGCGGGGPSYIQYLVGLRYLRNGGTGKLRVIAPKSLKDTDILCFGSWYGAPSVSGERLPAGTEILTAIESLNKLLGYKDFDAVVADEIGGGNGLATFPTSVHFDKPVVDGDFMGRAYPTMEHGTPYVYGQPITPCALADAKGNVSIVMNAESNARVESMLRTTAVELGLMAGVTERPLMGEAVKKYIVPNTLSQSWYLGRAIHLARRIKTDLIKAIFDVSPGKLLYTGKIIDVKRDISRGYTVGECIIGPLSEDEREEVSSSDTVDEQRHLVIPFQNEYLYAAYLDPTVSEGKEDVICTVPDLISILGQDGEAIGSPELRFGLKVKVIGMPAHPLWTGDPRGLRVGGPQGFGLDMEWTSIGKYQEPRSVIEDFNTR
ncbi:MAG: hypothetical protein M1834_005797 [Cirrosporium novae-zelandiae]|nr:MAG: hypothetical protein M1834_005797 [Cirrosporium novae-zelandiae]